MYALLYSLSTWFQPEVSGGGGAPAATPSSPAGGGAGGPMAALSQLALPILLLVVFYLVLIRPQQKRQKELDSLLKSLKKGQKVRTTGGIRGEIIDFKSEVGDEVVLLIADKVKINVLRSHIAGVLEQGSSGGEEQKK